LRATSAIWTTTFRSKSEKNRFCWYKPAPLLERRLCSDQSTGAKTRFPNSLDPLIGYAQTLRFSSRAGFEFIKNRQGLVRPLR
ncbi:MAG: hypothetical protein PHO64_06865, partial [Thiomonas sp.]|nr:hypothetical protein [Thiomonas sp.]